MKKGLTELVFILDRSGSMHGLEKDTIGGFNAMIEKQKGLEGEAYVSTVLFDTDETVLHDRVSLSKIRSMTEEDYQTGGGTALLDAVGKAIHHIGNVHKYAREEDVPEHTLFIITTDGMENSSHEYTRNEVRRKIRRQQEKYGWEFLFLGANIDAEEAAEDIGIRRDKAVTYCSDAVGTALNYEVLHEATAAVRSGATLDSTWKVRINEDRLTRKK